MNTLSSTEMTTATGLAQDLGPILDIRGSEDTYTNLSDHINRNGVHYSRQEPMPQSSPIDIGFHLIREYTLSRTQIVLTFLFFSSG